MNRIENTFQGLDCSHIVQIIPLTQKVYAVYKQGEGESKSLCHCMALKAGGFIAFMESDSGGGFEDPSDVSNFLRFEFED